MEIALYDESVTPWVERLDNGVARIHVDAEFDAELPHEIFNDLAREEVLALQALWFDPSIRRNYRQYPEFVLITSC